MALPQPHQIFSGSLLESLTPVEITIHIEVDLLGESPKADILLLRREGEAWNEAQRARLPDGVRDNAAGHVLVEFKYTESVNPKALAQAIAYDYFLQTGAEVTRGAGSDRHCERQDAAQRAAGDVGIRGTTEGRLSRSSACVRSGVVTGVK